MQFTYRQNMQFTYRPATRTAAWLLLLLLDVLMMMSSVAYADAIDDLRPGHWLEIPDSHLDAVSPDPIPVGTTGVRTVMGGWSGGAFDTNRSRLIVWGGGHTNYAGNELYAFDMNTLRWSRLNEPSSLDGWTDGDTRYSDGSPVSRHTYGYIEYIPPPYDLLFVGGGAGLWQGGFGDATTFLFDLASNSWSAGPVDTPNPGIGAIAVYDGAADRVWMHNAGRGTFLSEFSPSTNEWTSRGTIWTEPDGWIGYYWSCALDSSRRRLLAIGNGHLYAWDLSGEGDIVNTKPATSGATEVLSMQSPGFQYDPVSDQFVAWHGGAHIYTLDVDTWRWTKVAPAAENTVVPTTAAEAGTYGRFRYVPSRNVYIAVNRVDENVYVYRHTAGTGFSACAGAVCEDGQVCEASTGDCVTLSCAGVICAPAETCVMGVCVAMDAGLTDAGLTDAGLTDAGLTDAGLTDAGLTDGHDASIDAVGRDGGVSGSVSGCGCVAAGVTTRFPLPLVPVLTMIGWATFRRSGHRHG